MGKSVETKFGTTPEEQIFGVDPFKAVSNNTLNNIVSKSDSFGSGVANLLGTAGDVAATAGIVSFVMSGKLDKDYIVDKLGSTLKIDTTFLANTPIANAGKLLNSVGLIDDKTANLLTGKDSSKSLIDVFTTVHNGYKTTIDNVEKVIKDDMFDSFSNFTKAISSLNPNVANLINTIGLGEELALLKNIVDQTVALELPGLIDDIIKDIKDDKTKKAVLAQSLPNVLNAGNIEILDITIDTLGAGVILSMYPNVVSEFLKGYKVPTDSGNKSLDEQSVAFFAILNKLDKKWAYTYRDSKEIVNLAIFKNLSAASKQILVNSTDENIRSAAMIGGSFKPEDPMTLAKKYYTYI